MKLKLLNSKKNRIILSIVILAFVWVICLVLAFNLKDSGLNDVKWFLLRADQFASNEEYLLTANKNDCFYTLPVTIGRSDGVETRAAKYSFVGNIKKDNAVYIKKINDESNNVLVYKKNGDEIAYLTHSTKFDRGIGNVYLSSDPFKWKMINNTDNSFSLCYNDSVYLILYLSYDYLFCVTQNYSQHISTFNLYRYEMVKK